MIASKNFLRDLLGLILIISAAFAALSVLLDFLALIAYLNHEDATATMFFHESFYLLAFLVPAYFIGQLINRPNWVAVAQEYQLSKNIS
jgi:hypothetical protein